MSHSMSLKTQRTRMLGCRDVVGTHTSNKLFGRFFAVFAHQSVNFLQDLIHSHWWVSCAREWISEEENDHPGDGSIEQPS